MTSTADTLHYWIQERENIRAQKEEGLPKPWSTDPVFQQVYFCNVRREDDRVTRWIRENYHEEHGPAAPNMMLARLVNKISTLKEMTWPWSELWEDDWLAIMSKPGAWGSAYIVSTNGRAQPKHEYILGVLEQAWQANDLWGRGVAWGSLATAHRAIQGVPGFGSFLSAQVVADLKHTKHHPLAEAEDWKHFSAHGPGSLRGLGWYFDTRITPSMYDDAIRQVWVDLGPDLQAVVECRQNLQNCLCEFDKYMRVRNGTGRSKRKYDGV